RHCKLNREINQTLSAQIDDAEVSVRRDFANLVTDPVCYQRSLRIVENNALFIVQPARAFVHFGDDRVEPKGQNLISQSSLCWIEDLSLPRKITYEIGHVLCVSRSRCDDRRAFGLAIWDFANWTLSEQIVELRLRHFQHFWNCNCHVFSFRLIDARI